MSEPSLISYCSPVDDLEFCQTEFRYLDKDKNEGMIEIFDDWWNEQIGLYGTKVKYYVHGYDLEEHSFLFGEHTTAEYAEPKDLIIVTTISNDSIILSKFGIQSEAEFVAMIPIRKYFEVFGEGEEPKAGDLVWMEEWGRGRPNGREGWVFEVTGRKDFDVTQTNQLMGHYVWLLEGKRYDYSHEKGGKKEALNDQVYDSVFAGLLSGGEGIATDPKKYLQNVGTKSKRIFDYEERGVDTSPFGEYDGSTPEIPTTTFVTEDGAFVIDDE